MVPSCFQAQQVLDLFSHRSCYNPDIQVISWRKVTSSNLRIEGMRYSYLLTEPLLGFICLLRICFPAKQTACPLKVLCPVGR